MTRLALSGLTKTFPGATAPALNRLTLDVASGEMVALLGPSGSGKTTTLHLVAGLLAPDAGDIVLDGRSILRDRPEKRGTVMVFQSPLLFPFMSVADNVGFGLRMRHWPRARLAERVAEMLELVQLPDLGARRPAQLSGGQQQRVALARALVVEPRVLLLDEPLSGLDAHLRAEMRDLIRNLQRRLGITTIVVTHDQEEAVVLADRIALMMSGSLRQYDRPDAFFRRPGDPDVARFFGGRNIIAGQACGQVFDCALGCLVLPQGTRQGPGLLTVRPESVRIGAASVNTLQGQLTGRTYLGTQTRLNLVVGETAIEATIPPDLAEGAIPGAAVTFNLPPDSLWVMPHSA